MKYIIPISILLLILAVCIPLLTIDVSPAAEVAQSEETDQASAAGEEEPSVQVETEADAQTETETETEAVTSVADPASPEELLDKSMTISVLLDGEVFELTMYDYLTGVVAAEMPVSFEAEALKAQAVAARTYTFYKKLVSSGANHQNADVCGDYTCCSAYKSDAALREQWGEDYETNLEIITTAVRETDGVVMTYEDKPILAAFHSSSSGKTEASADIWGAVPYLQSVKTFEDEETVPNYYSAVELTYDEFKGIFLRSYPNAALDGVDTQSWITDVVRSKTGRITSIIIGGITLSGANFRNLYSLRSTNIEIEYGELGLKLTAKGYGHGVGMSQYGANYLASMGLDYNYILIWYYAGVALTAADTLR